MSRGTMTQLADTRVAKAIALEHAIGALGLTYAEYRQATRVLEMRANAELERGLHPAISLLLGRAGLQDFLERKLTGAAPSLAGVVDRQHRLAGVISNARVSGGAESCE
jgi:hypothetical protein